MTHKPINQAIILAGGKGTRLGDATKDTPKPMLPILEGGRPFIECLIDGVARRGYQDIVIVAGHLGDVIETEFHGRDWRNAHISVLREQQPLGTGGCLAAFAHRLEDRFVMMNGDALFDMNLRALEIAAGDLGTTATLALRKVDDVSRFGRVTVDGTAIRAFHEKDPTFEGEGLINGGIYCFDKKIVDLIHPGACSLETDVFPVLASQEQVHGVQFDGYFLDIGVPESLAQGRRELPEVLRRPAVFFDRDGVLNKDEGYTHRVEDLQFLPGAIEAIRHVNDKGWLAIVVTNQAGVARGYYTMDDVRKFHAAMQGELYKAGAYIDEFYVAPYHPDGIIPEFSIAHEDRKPGPGMILKAFQDWNITPEQSFLVGDKPSDVKAAKTAGLKGVFYDGGNLHSLVLQHMQAD
ncbi:HAD-IIIA family hydrolase [Roseobacter sp.]|uniref:HAD-IIIA family hydrolase n=1 Tax=Roseobacter sp. TaxID=1907202 RepID=UPI002967269B|nr:HAD-IIIA family hydrolase [Roseobacter sp.]MDW3181174.1 HAD-IIIA family hydrolase [Roseobacter sp.]